MTEHSICHPGRPGPHVEGHDGSPGLADFQRAKSQAERLPSVVVKEPGDMAHVQLKALSPD